MPRVALALSSLLVLALASSCKPKEGQDCKIETKEACVDLKSALACHDGKWEKISCKGPKGCVTADGEGECDQSIAESADPCNLAEDHACAPDKKSMVRCSKYKFATVDTCLGPNACERTEKEARCDNTAANTGDPCTNENHPVCSVDAKTVLLCKGGKLEEHLQCKGTNGCTIAGPSVKCDDSIAQVNDACEENPGKDHFACAQDNKSLLKCDGTKFVQSDKCRGKDTCKRLAEGFGCAP